jgi:predicted transcriptional regulator
MNTITFMTRYKSYTEMQEHLSVRHKQILEILKNKKMTTREIAEELYNRHYTNTADVNNARPRITELENLGFVVTDKTKKCNVTNKEVAVYRQTTEVEKMIKANINHIPQID